MKKIKKAIIPAAGLGSRRFPWTKHINKLMLPILNKPAVHYLMEELVDAGIEEIFISGRNLFDVKEYFRQNKHLENMTEKFGHEGTLKELKKAHKRCKIHFIDQKKPKGWMHEIWHLRRRIKKEPFVLAFSDTIYEKDINITKELIKKYNKTKLNITSDGRYVFYDKIYDFLKSKKFFEGDDSKIVIQTFSDLTKKGDFVHLPSQGKSYDIGHLKCWLEVNLKYALTTKDKELYKEMLKNVLNQ